MINVILACAGAALAGSAWNGPAAVESAAPAAVVAQAAGAAAMGLAEGEAEQLAPSAARACVYAVSKNICESRLTSTAPQVGGCAGTGCRTVHVADASWRIPIVTNRQRCIPCSGPGQCDETERLDGLLGASVQWTMRYNGPCPFRGCIEGRWQHQVDGVLYQGIVTGTMGAGTHRFNQLCCDTSSDRTCERCLDVEFIPSSDDTSVGVWRIGVEATFDGRAVNTGEPIPDKLHFTVSGDLYADGTKEGPYLPTAAFFTWRFVGTADGVFVDYCN